MKKLGEEWVEVIDGEEHMVKAVEGKYCQGCMYSSGSKFGEAVFWRCMREGETCPFNDDGLIIKDLSVLSNGVLPCPFCGEYPERIKSAPKVCCDECGYAINIDAWNRRS